MSKRIMKVFECDADECEEQIEVTAFALEDNGWYSGKVTGHKRGGRPSTWHACCFQHVGSAAFSAAADLLYGDTR